ncbi:MAG: substrate-binding domain-containing protein [Deltaproteobacteria bacterium]|nr:substrate-binding domain-containing protein [Deltaproteobacteria bacterium]
MAQDGGRRSMRRRTCVLGLGALLAWAACRPGSGCPGKKRIAVIPKGTTHEFWRAVHAGAVKAARELGVEIVWKGPLKEDDLKSQIEIVQSFVAQKASGIVLAPLSDKGLVGPVRAAREAGIPVVVFDSDLQGDAHGSFVATDNVAAGRLAGEHLAKILGDKKTAILLRYQEGSASTANRERGFLEAMRAHPEIRVLSDNQYGGATTESAFATSESLLAAQRAAAGELGGIFAPNESTTFGMLLALRKAGLAGKIRYVGFDASDKLVAAVREGHVDALVLQDPLRIGYLAVGTMVRKLRGETVEPRIDTGATLVTRENLETPAVRQLVAPDLRPWLGE